MQSYSAQTQQDQAKNIIRAQCKIHIQQKFFPNAVNLNLPGRNCGQISLFELSFSSYERKLVQKLCFVHSRIDQLSYHPAAMFLKLYLFLGRYEESFYTPLRFFFADGTYQTGN
jgi:hypothetical protein